jgi:secreted trypsin-like serine protease
LFIDTPHGPALIGVVSRGDSINGQPCASGGVYVRADKVVAWIERETQRKLERSPCDGGKADAPGVADEESGCSAGGGALGAGVLVVIAAIWALTWRRNEKRWPEI